jgi:molybdenum cofactor synthesis domain-containing protein
MVEDTSPGDGDDVRVHVTLEVGQHVGRRGGDVAAGETVLDEGSVMTAARVGALAALGRPDVKVYAKPRVVVASSGNEIVAPGRPLAAGQIYDINTSTLPPVIAAHGGEVVTRETIPDRVEALRDALDAAAWADLIVISGGSSVGERDLLVDAVLGRGEVLFHGIAVKPGKPTLLAAIGPQLLLGMPGNPTSCLSNAYILLVPLVRALARLPEYRPLVRRLPLARAIVSTVDRHQFYSVRIEADRVVPAFKGSGDITSLSRADGYIEIPAGTGHLDEGTFVEVTLF